MFEQVPTALTLEFIKNIREENLAIELLVGYGWIKFLQSTNHIWFLRKCLKHKVFVNINNLQWIKPYHLQKNVVDWNK